MLKIIELNKTYKSKSGNISALKNISLEMPNTGLIFITGKSGCGKSTLLNVLGALDSFDSGDIVLNGKSFSSFSEKNFDSYRNEYVGFVFQEFHLLSDYSVEQNIQIALDLQGQKTKSIEINRILEKVGLSGYGKRHINELSGGQKQRVAIARALIKKPKIVLCDEPTGALDSETSKEIFSLLKELSQEYLIIVVSHDQESARNYSDRNIELKDGEVAKDESKKSGSIVENEEIDLRKRTLSKKRVANFGFNFFKKKPIRLILAILISVISISLFSFSTTLSSNNVNQIVTKSMMEDDFKYMSFYKEVWFKFDAGYSELSDDNRHANMGEDDVAYLKQSTGIDDFDNVYDFYVNQIVNFKSEINNSDMKLYRPLINGFMEIDESILDKYDFELHGNLPTNDDEVVITDYFYKMFVKYGYKRFEDEVSVSKYDDLFGKILYVSDDRIEGKDLKIVGILDTGFNYNRYDEILKSQDNIKTSQLVQELYFSFISSVHNIIYLSSGYYERNIGSLNLYKNRIGGSKLAGMSVILNEKEIDYNKGLSRISSTNAKVYYKNENHNPNNGIILRLSTSCPDVEFYMQKYLTIYAQENFDKIKDKIMADYSNITTWQDYETYMLRNNYSDEKYMHITYQEVRDNTIRKFIDDNDLFNKLEGVRLLDRYRWSETYPAEICGFFDDNAENVIKDESIYVTDAFYDYIIEDYGFLLKEIKYVVTPLQKDFKNNLSAISIRDNKLDLDDKGLYFDEYYNYTIYRIDNEYFASYSQNKEVINSFKNMFQIISLIMLIVVVVFIYYYFSGVILEKKKEIGILRAIGSSKFDIFKILFVADLLLALIIILLSSLSTVIVVNITEYLFLKNNFDLLSIVNLSAYQFVIIFVATITSIVAGVINPTIQILKERPVNIINK